VDSLPKERTGEARGMGEIERGIGIDQGEVRNQVGLEGDDF
jgi:hypothetical protein